MDGRNSRERREKPNDHRRLDAEIAGIAARQHRNITRARLLALGLNDNTIGRRVRHGWLHRTHRGVYSVGTPATTPVERASAAVLACGPDASLASLGAAKLYGFGKTWPARFEVLVPRDVRIAGIRTHIATDLTNRDRRPHMGIWVTSPARTVLDCAPSLDERQLARLVNDARLANLLTLSALADVLMRFPRHRGARRLTPFIETRGGPTRSVFEDLFPAFCERFALPQPVMNTPVAGYEADAYFAKEGVIVELDGYEFHSDRATWEGDRERDAHRLDAGLLTVRLTWDRMIHTPVKEAGRLGRILERRRNGG